MHERLRNAYYEYLDDLARAGIIDHSLNNAVLAGTPVEEHVIEVLRAAGRLPEGWDGDHDRAVIEDWRDVPSFASEDEETEFWLTHSLGGRALESLGTLDGQELPPPRSRKRRGILTNASPFVRDIESPPVRPRYMPRPEIVVGQRDWLRAS